MQKKTDAFIASHDLSCGVNARYIDLTSEIGELGKALLKGSHYGSAPFQLTENAKEELGDCLFSLLALCTEMGVDAQSALNEALAKYESRFAHKGSISSDQA